MSNKTSHEPGAKLSHRPLPVVVVSKYCPWDDDSDSEDNDVEWDIIQATSESPSSQRLYSSVTSSTPHTEKYCRHQLSFRSESSSMSSGSDRASSFDDMEATKIIKNQETASRIRKSSAEGTCWKRLIYFVLVVACCGWMILKMFLATPAGNVSVNENACGKKSVYVMGGGFSGFWFTLGRLKSLETHPNALQEYEFYCFSAGCLAVVAVLENYTVTEMIDMALDTRSGWENGDIDRYEVVPLFLDKLLNEDSTPNPTIIVNPSQTKRRFFWNNRTELSKINIITTSVRGSDNANQPRWFPELPPIFRLNSSIRKPKSREELRMMLLQTTWIPFAVGRTFLHEGHMDGAFSFWLHPSCCTYTAGLAWSWSLLSNALNIGLQRSKASLFWNMGLDYGL